MRLLMCAPSHYGIHYEINPWMKRRNAVNPDRAMEQWAALYQALRSLGVTIELVAQEKGFPDMVFTANAGVVSGRTFIPSHFRFKERRGEETAFIRHFKRDGYHIRDAAKGLFFEGEGDLLPYADRLFGGYRFRSEIRALEKVGEAVGKPLVALELSRAHFYHLDTCFFPLDAATALYYPGAFDAYGRKAIMELVKNPLAVGREDAYQFACNGLRVDRTAVMNQATPRLKRQLARLGYRVLETPTSEFIKAGGSVKCLVLRLN